MSFEFLAPDAAVARRRRAGRRCAARSSGRTATPGRPLRRARRLAGRRPATAPAASELAACRDAVGVADLSFLGKLELQAEPDVVASIVAGLAGGAALAPGRATLARRTSGGAR